MSTLRFPFVAIEPTLGEAAMLPFLPINLNFGENSIQTAGLLDTGATVNVLPYTIGLELGAQLEELAHPLVLTGNLANFEAKAIIVNCVVGDYPSVRLAFAWTKSNEVPVLLGQTNFFMTFNVCFFRPELFFEVKIR